MSHPDLAQISEMFKQLRVNLTQRLVDYNSKAPLHHIEFRDLIYKFSYSTAPRPTTQDKVEINKMARMTIRAFIYEYMAPKFVGLTSKDTPTLVRAASQGNAHKFVTTVSQCWADFQRLVYALNFVCDKLDSFFDTFYKMQTAKNYFYPQEIYHVAAIATEQLNKFYQQNQMFDIFPDYFNMFFNQQRLGKNVPRQDIRDTMNSLQSCLFNLQAGCFQRKGKLLIEKKNINLDSIMPNRRSMDHVLFKNHLLDNTLKNCQSYYEEFVKSTILQMSFTEELELCLKIVDAEEQRACYYIRDADNRKKYIDCFNESLIAQKIEFRLRKADGLSKYIEGFEEGKEDFAKELKDFWRLYSRVLSHSLPVILSIYENYLMAQGAKASTKIKKPIEFIQFHLDLNSKNSLAIEFLGNNLEMTRQKLRLIRKMLQNSITPQGTQLNEFDVGAKNLAEYIHQKFKAAYSKNGMEGIAQNFKQIVSLFKILLEKSVFIDEHENLLAVRLLEEFDFSNDANTTKSLGLEKQFIKQIELECGVADAKNLNQFITDIEYSIETTRKLKTKQQRISPLNQIIIKTAIYWQGLKVTSNVYNIDMPNQLLPSSHLTLQYFKKADIKINIEGYLGMSIFMGDFEKGKQVFQLNNLAMLVLINIDEAQYKKLSFANLKRKIEPYGVNCEESRHQLRRTVCELLYSGLLRSPTKKIEVGSPDLCRVDETDEFEINRSYDFVQQQQRKNLKTKQPIKPISVVKSINLQFPDQIRRKFMQQLKQIKSGGNLEEKAKRNMIIDGICLKTLKHACFNHIECTIDSLVKDTQDEKNIQHRITLKEIKERVDNFIRIGWCERAEGKMNVLIYKA